MPSMVSLMRLVPTVTVLAWCLMASTGRAMVLMALPRQAIISLIMLRAVPFLPKSNSNSASGSFPARYLQSRIRSEVVVRPRTEGNLFSSFFCLNCW